jgi:hypothetical protein
LVPGPRWEKAWWRNAALLPEKDSFANDACHVQSSWLQDFALFICCRWWTSFPSDDGDAITRKPNSAEKASSPGHYERASPFGGRWLVQEHLSKDSAQWEDKAESAKWGSDPMTGQLKYITSHLYLAFLTHGIRRCWSYHKAHWPDSRE